MQTTGVQSSYERKEFSLGSMKEEQENDEDDNVDKIQLLKKPYEKNLEDQTPQENKPTRNLTVVLPEKDDGKNYKKKIKKEKHTTTKVAF